VSFCGGGGGDEDDGNGLGECNVGERGDSGDDDEGEPGGVDMGP
jgi:hypothetical protein